MKRFLPLLTILPLLLIIGCEKNGLYTEYYKNGGKKSEGNYIDGKKDGVWTEWSENGQKIKEGAYKDDFPIKMHYEWYSNGQMKMKGVYNGLKIGLWTHWLEDGQIDYESYHKDGKELKHGFHTESYGTYGGLESKSEGKYEYGKRTGVWTHWIIEYAGNKDKVYKITDNWVKDKREGQRIVYAHDDIIDRIENYKNGKLDGVWKDIRYDYENEKYKKNIEGNYKDGKRNGTWTFWSTRYDSDYIKLNCKDGILDGPFLKAYGNHKKAKKSLEGNFKMGKQVGLWKSYNADGSPSRKHNFDKNNNFRGFPISSIEWAPKEVEIDGESKTQNYGRYIDGEKHGEWNWKGGRQSSRTIIYYNDQAILEKNRLNGRYIYHDDYHYSNSSYFKKVRHDYIIGKDSSSVEAAKEFNMCANICGAKVYSFYWDKREY